MSRPLALVLGVAADRAWGDPRRRHPVAGFGQAAARLERLTYADRRSQGAGHVALLVGASALVGAAAERLPGRLRAPAVAAAVWVVLGGTSLDREAAAVEQHLLAGDLPAARAQVARLVGRDVDVLDESGVARAVIESVAENTSDAVVAPLVWGALLGAPGLLAYRAANTLDAMIGHHSARYERFGWAAARLDDALNLPGARLSAGLAVLLGPDPRGGLRAWRRDAGAHPSPNAGPVEAAFAGALGLTLGGTVVYPYRVEERPRLGRGHAPRPHDVTAARRLARRVQAAALMTVLPVALRRDRRRDRRRRAGRRGRPPTPVPWPRRRRC